MSRLIFLLAVIVVVYLLLRSYRRQTPPRDTSATAEEMVSCVQCGMHLPKSESIASAGNFYCCEAHRRDHAAK